MVMSIVDGPLNDNDCMCCWPKTGLVAVMAQIIAASNVFFMVCISYFSLPFFLGLIEKNNRYEDPAIYRADLRRRHATKPELMPARLSRATVLGSGTMLIVKWAAGSGLSLKSVSLTDEMRGLLVVERRSYMPRGVPGASMKVRSDMWYVPGGTWFGKAVPPRPADAPQ